MERRKKGLPDEDESDEERDVGDPFRRMDQNQMGKVCLIYIKIFCYNF